MMNVRTFFTVGQAKYSDIRWNQETETEHLSINSDECIECDACEAACPVTAIFEESLVPQEWGQYIAINANSFKR